MLLTRRESDIEPICLQEAHSAEVGSIAAIFICILADPLLLRIRFYICILYIVVIIQEGIVRLYHLLLGLLLVLRYLLLVVLVSASLEKLFKATLTVSKLLNAQDIN